MKKLFVSFFATSMLTLIFTSNSFAHEQYSPDNTEKGIIVNSDYSYPTKKSYSDKEISKAEKESLELLKKPDNFSMLANDPDFISITEEPELEIPTNSGYSDFFSVPTKVVIKNTHNYTDFDEVLDTSPSVEKGMEVSLSYGYDTYAELSCDFDINQRILETKLGYKLGASIHKTASMTKHSAPYAGHIAVYPQYSVTTFEIYTRSRRPVGSSNPWVLVGKGSVKRLRNAFCKFVRD